VTALAGPEFGRTEPRGEELRGKVRLDLNSGHTGAAKIGDLHGGDPVSPRKSLRNHRGYPPDTHRMPTGCPPDTYRLPTGAVRNRLAHCWLAPRCPRALRPALPKKTFERSWRYRWCARMRRVAQIKPRLGALSQRAADSSPPVTKEVGLRIAGRLAPARSESRALPCALNDRQRQEDTPFLQTVYLRLTTRSASWASLGATVGSPSRRPGDRESM